jgi:glutamate formiminotransferase/formiminotetrahydrofolate cyclodeaminase
MIERSKASKLIYLPTTSFVQNVASRAPVPGGGSVAALSGSLGAGLYVMVCRLSIPKAKEHESYFRELTTKGMELRDRLRDLVDLDSVAYEDVIEAAKLPDGNEEEKAAKQKKVQAATRKAAEVPFQTAQACAEGLSLGLELAQKCFAGAVTDVGVGCQSLLTGFLGARLNVLVNLGDLEDTVFAGTLRSELDEILPEARETTQRVLETVEGRL